VGICRVQAALRSPSICLNQASIWFQLVKLRLTSSTSRAWTSHGRANTSLSRGAQIGKPKDWARLDRDALESASPAS